MAVTASARLGITRWSASTDPFTRAQLDGDHATLDTNVALFIESTAALRPAPGTYGRFHRATDTGALSLDTVTAWVVVGFRTDTKTVRIPHTFAIPGDILLPSGSDNIIPGFFVPVSATQTVKLAAARYQIQSGTSVTATVNIAGAAATGFSGLAISTTAATTDPADVVITDGQYVNPVVTATSGTPKNMSLTLYLDYTPVVV